MNPITLDSTIEAILAAVPESANVFEKMGIDYCCGGKATLEKACKGRGIDPETVLEAIRGGAKGDSEEAAGPDPEAMTPAELADHVERVHHAYLWEALDQLNALTMKVAAVHGGRDARLIELRNVYIDLAKELADHMLKEEQILFPMIRRLQDSTGPQHFHCGSVGNPIRKMDLDHEEAGAALFRIRNLTDGFIPPSTACFSYRKMLSGLEAMEKDLIEHMRKETYILFPKALALESAG
jgi:regulator of cell morphogenesis and NO signaling